MCCLWMNTISIWHLICYIWYVVYHILILKFLDVCEHAVCVYLSRIFNLKKQTCSLQVILFLDWSRFVKLVQTTRCGFFTQDLDFLSRIPFCQGNNPNWIESRCWNLFCSFFLTPENLLIQHAVRHHLWHHQQNSVRF